jgi:hypothetical protein
LTVFNSQANNPQGNWRSRRAKPVMLRIIGVCAKIGHNP